VRYEIAVIGTSWGGLNVLRTLVAGLPAGFESPVVVVQHRQRRSDTVLAQLLQEVTAAPVCDVEDKAPILPGGVYLAPADYHLLVERGHFVLSVDEPVGYNRPSIDLTFSSVADAYGAGTGGVVLSGANADGAQGLKRIAERGGTAIVQRLETADVSRMPAAAMAAVPTARIMTVEEIRQFLFGAPASVGERART
jgi:two-component system chemotaxis response regulator CheB